MKRFFYLIWIVLFFPSSVQATGFGASIEGDSTGVTITLNNARDSVWLRFASPDNNFYDSVKAVPIAGTNNKMLIAPYINLDSIGGHLMVAFTFTGDAVAETVIGQWLHENPVASRCSGSGTYTVTLYLLNDADSTAVSGVIININDSTSGVWQAGHITPANGIRQFSLDASTYTIHLQDPPNAITSPEYMTISADTTDTFWVETFDPGAPPSGDQCRVWCIVPSISANWVWGCRLTAEIPKKYRPVLLGDSPISPYSVSATSNDTGYVYLDLYESGELTGRTGAGTVKVQLTLIAPNGYVIVRTEAEIPDASDWEIEW